MGQIIAFNRLAAWRNQQVGRRVVATNGCFDIFHAGHLSLLRKAKSLGDVLIVGLNGDHSVRELKGEGRPINNERDRADILSALTCVDAVCIFHSKRATEFLRFAEPHVYVKGDDYTLETLDPDEREALGKASIVFSPLVLGLSTTSIVTALSA